MKTVTCILRSVDGGANLVYLESWDEKGALVKPLQGPYDKPLWFPRSELFEPNDELLQHLKDAYSSEKESRLSELWGRAIPWQIRINR